MSIIPFGEFRPDVSDFMGQTTQTVNNVFPRGDGYGPVAALLAASGALAAACRGLFFARKNDGTVQIFAGTSNKLYTLNNTTLAWTDVSLGSGTYTGLASSANWQFAQFNNFVFAVQVNAAVQVYDLTSSTNFANLSGSPPQAAYVAVVNRFLVLTGIASPNVYRIQWSGLNDTVQWTSGTEQSDFQDLADGGLVRGVAGGEFGVTFQDDVIRRMTFAPGSPYVFGIDKIAEGDGLLAPYSLVKAQDRVFYLSPQGFKRLDPGGYPVPIGKEKINRTFFADLDANNLQLVIGCADPKHSRVYWAYKSVNGASGLFDKVMVHDWILDRWAVFQTSGEYLASISQPGITLEGVDSAFGSNLDTLTISSFDNISNAALAKFAGIDASHKLGFFNGSNLEATLRTPEQGDPNGQRIFVKGFRPITDAASVYGKTIYRDNAVTSTTTSTTEALADLTYNTGLVPQRIETKFARAHVRIPAGQSWNYASGVEPDVDVTGRR